MQIRHLIAAWVGLAVVVLTYVSRTEALLLRTDPSVVPTKPALMGFAQRRGEALYESHCMACHGARGRAYERGIPDLSDGDWLYGSDRDALWRSIAYGRAGSCPAWATRLSAADIREVAAFVYTLSRPARARATVVPAPAAPARTDTAPAVAAPMLTPKRGVA